MVRSIVIFSAVIFSAIAILVSPAMAFPLRGTLVAPTSVATLEVRLTKSNACKPKYRHRKAAQELREKAHCK